MNADEMLNELGYKKAYEGSYLRYEAKNVEDDIYFWLDENQASVSNASLSVLKAVIEKCKELGWLE